MIATPNPSRDLTLAPGLSETITIAVAVKDTGGKGQVNVSFANPGVPISVSEDSTVLSDLSASTVYATSYDTLVPVQVKVTAPSDIACQTTLDAAKVMFSSDATGIANNGDSAEVVINLTVSGPSCTASVDGDTVPDYLDNCPSVANADQADADGDGTGDACDTVAPPANTAPTVDAGGPYSGVEGANIAIGGTATDPDAGDTVTHTWSYATGTGVDAGATCSFVNASALSTTVSCTDDGSYTLTLTANDGVNSNVTDTADLTVSNANPAVTGVTVTPTGACSASVSAPFTDAGSNDTHSSSIDWGDSSATTDNPSADPSPVTGSHTYSVAGTKTITVTVTDDDTGSGFNTASFIGKNTPSGILQPINLTGTRSSFKLGSTIPVKITVKDCAGATVTNLTPTVHLSLTDSVPDNAVNEVVSTSTPTAGIWMRWDGVSQYIYNLSTKNSQFFVVNAPLPVGTYWVGITDPTFYGYSSASFDVRK